MITPLVQTVEFPARLQVKLRPSSKYPGVVVGEYLLAIASMGVGIGLEARFMEEVLGSDPMVAATEAGLHRLQEFLGDAVQALAHRHAQVAVRTEALPLSPGVEALQAELEALQTKYDALLLHGLGIGDV